MAKSLKPKRSTPKLTRPTSAYEMLSQVAKLIEREPKRYDQESWIRYLYKKDTYVGSPRQWPACGTIACVAGWVEVLRTSPRRTSKYDKGVSNRAARALGLNGEQEFELFDGGVIFKMARDLGIDVPETGTKAYVALGVGHIRNFQRKYAAQLKRTIVRPGRLPRNKVL